MKAYHLIIVLSVLAMLMFLLSFATGSPVFTVIGWVVNIVNIGLVIVVVIKYRP